MKLKTIIGILLIVLSIAAMFFWESSGRELLTTTSVLVCSEPVHKGQKVSLSDFKTKKIDKGSVLEGAVLPQDVEALEGTVANVDIVENQQILASYFSNAQSAKSSGRSIYVIPKEWIFSRSSALRSGDTVTIYKMPDKEKLGTFPVAFVRDASEQEVTDIEPGARAVLDRKDSGRMISGIEIICTLDDYSKLYESVLTEVTAPGQTVLPEEEEIETEEGDAEEADAPEQEKTTEIMANLLIVMEDAI